MATNNRNTYIVWRTVVQGPISYQRLIEFGPGGSIIRIVLNKGAPKSQEMGLALARLIKPINIQLSTSDL